ncbi:MAG: S24 family peptidase, partial [Pseudomonadota bacterium]
RFFTVLETERIPGAFGKLVGANAASGCAKILDGLVLDRLRTKAEGSQDPDDMVSFINKVRVYAEELLRIMLRGQAPEISGDTLAKLVERLGALHRQGQPPFSQAPFEKVVKAFDGSNPIVKLIQKPHHEDDGTIGKPDFENVCEYWKKRIKQPIDDAFQVAADYAQHIGPPQAYTWVDNVVNLPTAKSESLGQVQMIKTGVAAAASTDGRVGDGLISVTEQTMAGEPPVQFHNHSAFILTKPNLTPVVEPGDLLIVRNFGEPKPRNLVVAAYGDALLARRLNDAEGMTELAILTGQARNPYELPDAVTAPKHRLESRKIIGTLFTGFSSFTTENPKDEVKLIEDGSVLSTFLSGTLLLEVSGQSMEPIALDGQKLIVSAVQCDPASVSGLDGRLIIAATDAGGAYFKRLRMKGELAILEAVNSNYGSETELVSLEPRSGFDHLTQLYAVRGVLFEDP